MRFFHNLRKSKGIKIAAVSVAWTVLMGMLLFVLIMIYLLVADYFYNEDNDKFNENGEKITLNW